MRSDSDPHAKPLLTFNSYPELVQETLRLLAICHECIIDQNKNNQMDSLFNYQGPSPDEIALVDAAQRLGFKYCGLKDGIIQIEEQTSNKIH